MMPLDLKNLPKETQALLNGAAELTPEEIGAAELLDLKALQMRLLALEGDLPAEVAKNLRQIVKRQLEGQAPSTNSSNFRIETADVTGSEEGEKQFTAAHGEVVKQLQEKFGEKPKNPRFDEKTKNPRFDEAKASLETAVKNNSPEAMSKESLGIFFAHASSEEVKEFANRLHEKVYGDGISNSYSEGYKRDNTHNGSAVFVAFQDLLQKNSYSDIRSNPWLMNLGSRTFIETFYKENTARFEQVVKGENINGKDRGKVFEELIDGALHTSIKGHDKSSFSFGLFAKESHHDAQVLGKIEDLMAPSSSVEKKK